MNNIKIDAIIGWINPNEYDTLINRTRDNNELKYCLRSIYKYANWINKIHIIIANNGNPPKWLKKHSKINIIKETDIKLYKKIQPNSETKKLFYGTIENLSDYFLTFDDDFFINDYIKYNDLFYNNKPILNSTGIFDINNINDGIGHMPLFWSKKSYNLALKYLTNKNIYLNMNKLRYNPYPEMKRILLKLKLIHNGNIKKPCILINDRNIIFNFKKNYVNKKIKYICINDDFSTNNIELYKIEMKYLYCILNNLYNFKAPWEKI